jgi:hypothetical protein
LKKIVNILGRSWEYGDTMGINVINSNNEILGNVRNLIGVLCEVTGKMGIGLEYPKVEQPHFRLVNAIYSE